MGRTAVYECECEHTVAGNCVLNLNTIFYVLLIHLTHDAQAKTFILYVFASYFYVYFVFSLLLLWNVRWLCCHRRSSFMDSLSSSSSFVFLACFTVRFISTEKVKLLPLPLLFQFIYYFYCNMYFFILYCIIIQKQSMAWSYSCWYTA